MRTLLLSNNEAVSRRVRDVLVREGHECQVSPPGPPEQAASRLAQLRPELSVLVLSPDPEAALNLLPDVRNTTQGQLLAVGPAADSKLRLRALRGGVDYYLEDTELEAELEAILARQRAPRAAAPAPVENGHLFSVLAPSGGSGASTLAVNLATLLAKERKSCALFDLRLGGGDLAALLDLKPTHTLADLCRNCPRMDRVMFEHSLVRHECGVALLAPPRAFADIAHVTTQGVRQALGLALGMFPYVVADLDDSFHPEQTQTLNHSDLVFLVLRLDFTSLRNTKRTIDHLEQMGVNRERVRLVVNRYGQPEELPASKAEHALGMKIFHYVPDDPKTINRANNHGVPAVLDSPSSKYSKNIGQLVANVTAPAKAR